MRTRRIYYRDYRMSPESVKWLREYCRETQNLELLREAAEESCDAIAAELVKSVAEGKSHTDIVEKQYLPYGKEDFYGYQRKMLFLLKEKIMKKDEELKEYFRENGWIRRYCKVAEVAEELGFSMCTTNKIVKKSGAVVHFGRIIRVDMGKLYAYIDKTQA